MAGSDGGVAFFERGLRNPLSGLHGLPGVRNTRQDRARYANGVNRGRFREEAGFVTTTSDQSGLAIVRSRDAPVQDLFPVPGLGPKPRSAPTPALN
ncbi:hypothetical protein EYF80_003001 [Liparis tanakae]|uniref:Uncharacterized protein n=1 Tax=Liparis tanakae TaxID=230148 RepID=A0A4Z2JAX2_9TELE|nr:hypothetical protein EYF80_003001 [Liparis tanakae]